MNRQYGSLILATALTLTLALVGAPAQASGWSVDGAHTQVLFSVNHFFTPVSGSFSDFEIELKYDEENPANSKVTAKIAVDSVSTGIDKRDGHLRTADFFHSEKYPYMTFESTSVEPTESGLLAKGVLQIKDRKHEIEMPIEILGVVELPEAMRERMGAEKVASFKATTTIDRNDYDVGTGSWAATAVVGGDVEVTVLLEAKR